MMQAHYNIPKGSIERVLESIISHLTPGGCSEYARIADNIFKDARRLLLDGSRGMRQAVFRWSMAGFMAAGLGLFGALGKEEIVLLINERYRPPSSKYGATDYILTIFGTQVSCPGKYPLSVAIAESARLSDTDYELQRFGKLADEIGFEAARKKTEEQQDNEKMPCSFNVPLTEEIMKKKIEKEVETAYSDRFITDIQLFRFFWDFIGRGVEKAGYLPECVEGEVFSSSMPALGKDIELITAHPAIPAVKIAESMLNKMAGYFTDFGVVVALRRGKDMPDPEYKRIK